MKNKTPFLLLIPILILLSPILRADWSGTKVFVIADGTTNVVAAGTGGVASTNYLTNITQTIDCSRADTFSLAVTHNFHAAPVGVTPSLTLRLKRSMDGTNWESQGPFFIFTACGATNNCTSVTNFTVGALPFWQVYAVENTNSAIVTNLAVSAGVKK